jgi:hypothetical protein
MQFLRYHVRRSKTAATLTALRLAETGTARRQCGLRGLCRGLYRFLSGSTFAYPGTATSGDIVMVFKKYLNDHPEQWHEYRSVLLLRAAKAAYPCKK